MSTVVARYSTLVLALLFCASIHAQTYLINEGFATFPPSGWSVVNNSVTSTVVWGASTAGPSVYPGSLNGTQFALCNADAGGGTGMVDSTITSGTFDGTAAPGVVYLRFQQYFQLYVAGEIGAVEVFNGTSWVQVYSVTNTLGDWSPNANTQQIDITAHKNASNQVRFRYADQGNWGYWWAVDDVQVYYNNSGPEIDITHQGNVVDNGGTVYAGIHGPSTSVSGLNLLVTNAGSASLTHTVGVSNQVNCTAGATLAASTAVGSFSTMTVTCTTGATIGPFSFTLTVTNNDTTGGENPYVITVQGMNRGSNLRFYAGDWDGIDGTACGDGFTVPTDAWIYERFDVPTGETWTVTHLFANLLITTGATFTQADYEIRTGMTGGTTSPGTGGTVVQSGNNLAAIVTRYSLGNSLVSGYSEYNVMIQLAASFQLTAGQYFVGVRPVQTGATANAYVLTTSGANGTATPDTFAIFDDVPGQFTGTVRYETQTSDYSIAVVGSTSTAGAPDVTIAATGSPSEPSTTGTFTLTCTPAPAATITVNLSISGTASNGVDYQTIAATIQITTTGTATITLTPIDDSTVEAGGETVIIAVASGTGYNVGTPSSAQLTIADDDGGGGGGLSITTTTLPNGTINVAYSTTVAATGGTPAYSWSAVGLPAGLTINPSTGAITGTPTVSGTFPVIVTVTDSATPTPNTTNANFNLVIGTGGGGGGGGSGGGGGGGGGGCVATDSAAPYMAIVALLCLIGLALRRRTA